MKLEKNLKTLKEWKEILVNKQDVVVDLGDGYYEELYYDEEIKNYRGKEIGIWDKKLLLEIANGEVKNTSLKLKEE